MNKKEKTLIFIIGELSYILYNTLSLIKGKYSQKEIADNLKFELQKQIDTLDEILINSEKKGK